jgi:selenocysteine-specific elongation factor
VQLVLDEPVLALRGDRFILRDETARRTLGGGEVVNPFADRHKRSERALPERLEALRSGAPPAAVRAFLDLAPEFASEVAAVARALGLDDAGVRDALAAAPGVVPIPDASHPESCTTGEKWQAFETAALAAVAAAHAAQPLVPGVEMESLRSGLPRDVPPKTFRWCVDRLVAAKRLVREDSIVRSPEHRVSLGAEARALGERVAGLLTAGRFVPPDLRQLEESTGVSRARVVEVLAVLEGEGRVTRVAPDLYYSREAAAEAQALLVDHCRRHGEITAATFRDLIGASRKFAIAFLDWCDRSGVTVRVGDLRKLRR